MKILLIGHGRMGRLIEQTALAAGDEIVAVVDSGSLDSLQTLGKAADVVIDFSSPKALPAVAEYIRTTGTPLLSGTTGYTADNNIFHNILPVSFSRTHLLFTILKFHDSLLFFCNT